MSLTTRTPAYASPVDHVAYGEYGPGRLHLSAGWNRPTNPFQNRITADGTSGYRAEPGRCHLYGYPGHISVPVLWDREHDIAHAYGQEREKKHRRVLPAGWDTPHGRDR